MTPIFRQVIEKEPILTHISREMHQYLCVACIVYLHVPDESWKQAQASIQKWMLDNRMIDHFSRVCAERGIRGHGRSYFWIKRPLLIANQTYYSVYIFPSKASITRALREAAVAEVIES